MRRLRRLLRPGAGQIPKGCGRRLCLVRSWQSRKRCFYRSKWRPSQHKPALPFRHPADRRKPEFRHGNRRRRQRFYPHRNERGKIRYDDSFCGSGYRLIIDEAELGRTDWYAYTGDNFGTTRPSTLHSRQGSEEFVKGQNRSFKSGNEIMFRQGIPTESIQKIRCSGDYERDKLLKAFRDAGITSVNGIPIEDFVEVGDYL